MKTTNDRYRRPAQVLSQQICVYCHVIRTGGRAEYSQAPASEKVWVTLQRDDFRRFRSKVALERARISRISAIYLGYRHRSTSNVVADYTNCRREVDRLRSI